MTATITRRPFVVHGFEDDRDVTRLVTAATFQGALDESGFAAAWIHDDQLSDCPRCAVALAGTVEAVTG